MDLTHFQLSIEKKTPIETYAAGFPPYIRGNRADGYLLELPKIRKVEEKENDHSFKYENNLDWSLIIPTLQQIWNDYRDGITNTPTLLCIISEDINLQWVALIRALRFSWSLINQNKSVNFQPLRIEVQTSFGYHSSLFKILSAEVDTIISNQLNENILQDFIEDFKLLKTIDPFAGSHFIEEKTNMYAQNILKKITL